MILNCHRPLFWIGITGALWGLQSVEAVWKLRSLRSSGDLDACWVYHNSQVLRRNYIIIIILVCMPAQKGLSVVEIYSPARGDSN